MNDLLKEYLQHDLSLLEGQTELSLQERRLITKNIYRLIDIHKEFDELFDSNIELARLLEIHNKKIKKDLKEFLYKVSPYDFEVLISKLFNALGYKTETTKKSNDLGVDVIATVVIGLTTIKEVIQVKRQKSNIHRPVLDKLRGVIPLHDATTGTIITLGRFSDGCYKLVPKNIKLIDGDELIELLFKFQVGFNSKTIEIHKIDYDFFRGLPHKR